MRPGMLHSYKVSPRRCDNFTFNVNLSHLAAAHCGVDSVHLLFRGSGHFLSRFWRKNQGVVGVSLGMLGCCVSVGIPMRRLYSGVIVTNFRIRDVRTRNRGLGGIIMNGVMGVRPRGSDSRLRVYRVSVNGNRPMRVIANTRGIFRNTLIPTTLSSDCLPYNTRVIGNGLHNIRSGNVLYSNRRLYVASTSCRNTSICKVLVLGSARIVNASVHSMLNLGSCVVSFGVATGHPSYGYFVNMTGRVSIILNARFGTPIPACGAVNNSVSSCISMRIGGCGLYPHCVNHIIGGLHVGRSPT